GQRRMAIASPCEDTVTMAVEAAGQALEAFEVDPAEIGTLIVGTETGVDHSKPVAVYAHELLGLDQRCRTFETKHACYGAMAGLTASMDWIASGRARGRKALVIASDIARYGINTAGEPTQGAGAVAMVVSEQPRLLAIDPARIGDYTRQVMDFWRPLYSKYAFADGHFSIQCYLDALVGARKDAIGERDDLLEGLAACLYHVPFVKMAFKAHQRQLEIERGSEILRDDSQAWRALNDSYQRLVSPWLGLNAEIGNIYTGSLFLALIDLLRQTAETSEGREISLFSYGSGCGATFCVGQVSEGAARWRPALDPAEQLAGRHRLAIDEYESLLTESEHADQVESLDPARYGLNGGLYYVGTRDHCRQYARG
ncbi:MAG: hydroxymethylglutaryl-CoA synthase family protein, partial [Wenzhouxiangellaceae bacterium]